MFSPQFSLAKTFSINSFFCLISLDICNNSFWTASSTLSPKLKLFSWSFSFSFQIYSLSFCNDWISAWRIFTCPSFSLNEISNCFYCSWTYSSSDSSEEFHSSSYWHWSIRSATCLFWAAVWESRWLYRSTCNVIWCCNFEYLSFSYSNCSWSSSNLRSKSGS